MEMDLLVFDLDGTLIDSKLDLALAVNATRAAVKLPPLPHETISAYVGNGAPALIRRAVGDSFGEEQLKRSLDYFLGYYRAHMLENTRLYPGVREALDRIARMHTQIAVLTNKPVRFSRDLLHGLGVAKYFRAVYGGNSFETKKPDPEGLRKVMAELHAAPRRTMVVGDSAVDVRTARNAGAWACGVTYGFQPETLEAEAPDLLVDSLEELAEVLAGRRQPRKGALTANTLRISAPHPEMPIIRS
jgi:phosphoglycolate phosphatase